MDILHIEITKHAYLRMKQRNGWNKKTANRMIPRVYGNGKRAEEIKGYLKTWVNRMIQEDISEDEFVLYGKEMYIFRENTLITVLHIPTRSCIIERIC